MTITVKSFFSPVQPAAAADTTLYTATGLKAIIDKFTLTNTTAAVISISVHLVPSAGAAGVTNRIISSKAIQPGECYTCPEIVGHVLNAGDFISVNPTAVGITCRSSGREVTS